MRQPLAALLPPLKHCHSHTLAKFCSMGDRTFSVWWPWAEEDSLPPLPSLYFWSHLQTFYFQVALPLCSLCELAAFIIVFFMLFNGLILCVHNIFIPIIKMFLRLSCENEEAVSYVIQKEKEKCSSFGQILIDYWLVCHKYRLRPLKLGLSLSLQFVRINTPYLRCVWETLAILDLVFFRETIINYIHTHVPHWSI